MSRPLAVLAAVATFWVALARGTAGVHAQQPLDQFLNAASRRALDVRQARAALAQAEGGAAEARARLLPSVVGTASYTRNQNEVAVSVPRDGGVELAVITPEDQLDGRVTLAVPLIDVGAWTGFAAARHLEDAAAARVAVASVEVAVAVVELWHGLVAGRALVHAAERSLETAERGRASSAARVEVGVSPAIDLARAEAEVARARQTLAEAELGETLSTRAIEELTGLAPSGAHVDLSDDLDAEAPLATFLDHHDGDLPSVRAALADERATEASRDAAWAALLPVISGTATERVTNASGFGRSSVWAAGATATWTLDLGRPAAIGTSDASVLVARLRTEGARREASNAVFEAWHRVRSLCTRVQAASAAEEASSRAAEDARARFEAGAGTQLDQIQADRDWFAAQVQTIQATAELLATRAVLRLRSGTAVE